MALRLDQSLVDNIYGPVLHGGGDMLESIASDSYKIWVWFSEFLKILQHEAKADNYR